MQKFKVEDMGKVDLSRSGLASTSMATIEIVKGTAEAGNRSGSLTRSLSRRLSTRSKSRSKSDRTPSHLSREMPTPLGFCSHISPPTNVPPHHVLVQVWAVGLDSRDAAIVLKDKQTTPGFIPGRSFVGRAIEVGWEVREDVVKKGEWVVGLMEVKKVLFFLYCFTPPPDRATFSPSLVLSQNSLRSIGTGSTASLAQPLPLRSAASSPPLGPPRGLLHLRRQFAPQGPPLPGPARRYRRASCR